MDYIDEIYLSMQGLMTEEAAVPWVENVWTPDSICDRLGVDEDTDVEEMIDSLLRIQQELCRNMFLCGMKYRDMQK